MFSLCPGHGYSSIFIESTLTVISCVVNDVYTRVAYLLITENNNNDARTKLLLVLLFEYCCCCCVFEEKRDKENGQ